MNSRLTKVFPILLLALCGCGSASAREEPAAALIRGEGTVVRVNTKDCRSRTLDFEFAANELGTHLSLITGCTVPVVTNLTGREKYVINVGFLPPGEDARALKPEEGRWRLTATNAWFWGEGAGGTHIAAVTFLEDELDVSWPWLTNLAYRARNPIAVRHAAGAWHPEVRLRGIREGGGPARTWGLRMRRGAHDAPVYGHAFTDYVKRGFLVTHPEYFAMRADGKRLPPNAGKLDDAADITRLMANQSAIFSMCVSSTSLVQQVVADWVKAGKREYVNICENDSSGRSACVCPACQALDCPPPPEERREWWRNWYADRYTHFGNEVLKAVRRIRPDAKACFYAYNATEQPPRRLRGTDGLIVGLVPTLFTFDLVKKYVDGWTEAGFKDFFWRPNRHGYYQFPVLPVGCEKHFFRIFQYVQSKNPIGYDYDCGRKAGVLEYFRDYLIYKGMQDPSKSFEYWEDRYFAAFGAAKEDVRAYFRYWREEVWEKRLEPNILTIPKHPSGDPDFQFTKGLLLELGKWYSEEDFTKAKRFLDSAARRKGLSDGDRGRIAELQLAHEHGLLFFRAVANKCEKNAAALYEFRRAHHDRFELIYWAENYYGPGDLTGCREYLFAHHPEDVETGIYKWETRRLTGRKLKPHEEARLKFLKSLKPSDVPKPPTWR